MSHETCNHWRLTNDSALLTGAPMNINDQMSMALFHSPYLIFTLTLQLTKRSFRSNIWLRQKLSKWKSSCFCILLLVNNKNYLLSTDQQTFSSSALRPPEQLRLSMRSLATLEIIVDIEITIIIDVTAPKVNGLGQVRAKGQLPRDSPSSRNFYSLESLISSMMSYSNHRFLPDVSLCSLLPFSQGLWSDETCDNSPHKSFKLCIFRVW